jgi:hypothetical protein
MRLLLLALMLCLNVAAHAQERMLYVEYHVIAPNDAAVSRAERETRKVWRIGTKFLRFEDVPNPETGVHGLIIVAEPDIWFIDRKTRQGQHSVDPGPEYAIHFPIFARESSQKLRDLEFGNEVAFFRENGAREMAPQTVDGVLYEALALEIDDRQLTLLMRGDGKPFEIRVNVGTTGYAVRITRYDTSVEPNPSLFKPPPGIQIR